MAEFIKRLQYPFLEKQGDWFYGYDSSDTRVNIFRLDSSGYADFDTTINLSTGNDLHLPSAGVISFDSGDVTITHATNQLNFAGATSEYLFDNNIGATGMVYVNNANGSALLNEIASSTNPTIAPDRSDNDTGLGVNAADSLSLIAGGTETLRTTSTVVSTALNFVVGDTSTSTMVDFVLGSGGTNNVRIFGTGTATQGLLHIRSTQTDPAYISFAEDNVSDVAQLGISPSDNHLHFNVGGDLSASTNILSLSSSQVKNKGGVINNVTTVNTATYDVLTTDYILNVTYTGTGAVTSLTLPSAQVVAGRTIIIKDGGGNATTNNITIDTGGSETIDGAATKTISSDYTSVIIFSDGSNWLTI